MDDEAPGQGPWVDRAYAADPVGRARRGPAGPSLAAAFSVVLRLAEDPS